MVKTEHLSCCLAAWGWCDCLPFCLLSSRLLDDLIYIRRGNHDHITFVRIEHSVVGRKHNNSHILHLNTLQYYIVLHRHQAEEILMQPWMHFVAQGGRSARLVSKTPPELMGRNAVVRHSPCRFRMPDRRSGSAGSCSPRAVYDRRELGSPGLIDLVFSVSTSGCTAVWAGFTKA